MGFSQPQAFARVFSSLLSKNGFSFPLTVSQMILDAMCDMFSPRRTYQCSIPPEKACEDTNLAENINWNLSTVNSPTGNRMLLAIGESAI